MLHLYCCILALCSSDLKDKMANDGCTATHIAVLYNHMGILEALIEAGANILALNLKMQTPLKLAADTKKLEIYRKLDNTIARMEAQNSMHVQKMQARAYEELKKKVKKVEKGQRHGSVSGYPTEGSSTSLDLAPEKKGKTLPSRSRRVTDSELQSAASKMHDLCHKVQTLPFYDNFQLRNASSEEKLKESRRSSSDVDDETRGDGIRMGKLFPTRNNMINALNSIQMPNLRNGDDERYVSGTSDPGSATYKAVSPHDDNSTGGIPPQPVLTENDSPLAAFLHAYDVADTMQDLVKERMDLDALMMCSELDLQRAGIPLGPTKKIMAAVHQRRTILETPGKMHDLEV